ncbi:MAG: class I SAM-dependent methyltransferase [Myxococcota bacterium]
MELPRLQLFEFNDAAWAPSALRDLIVDTLGVALERGHLLDGLVAPFARFIEAAGTDRLLDLCAGSGAPARVLLDALSLRGHHPQLTLTDLHPHGEEWEVLARSRPQQIDHVATPVDATAVDPSLAEGRARVIINALHHFPPSLVSAIFADAVREGRGIFVAESFGRDPRGFLVFADPGLRSLYSSPLRGRRRLARAALVWATPAALLASLWDGLVSTMRIYTEADLRALVAPFGDAFEWHFGWYPVGRRSRGCWFYGVPRARGA